MRRAPGEPIAISGHFGQWNQIFLPGIYKVHDYSSQNVLLPKYDDASIDIPF